MGLGQALGRGVATYNANEAQRAKEEMANREMLDRERQTNQTISASKTNQKHKEMQIQELQQQQIQRAEIQKQHNKYFNVDNTQNQTNDTTVLQEEVAAVKQEMGDMKAVNVNDNFSTNYLTDIRDTKKFTEFGQLNEWVASNELFKGMVNDTLVKYNPNDPSHKKAIAGMLKPATTPEEQKQVEGLMIAITKSAESGQIAFGAKDGKAWDIMGMLNTTGITKRISKSLMEGAKTSSNSLMVEALEKQPSKANPNKGGLGIEPFKPKTYNGRDPKEINDFLKYSKRNAPPGVDLDAMEKYNEEGRAKEKETIARASMETLFDRAIVGDISKGEMAQLKNYVAGLETDERKSWLEEIEQAEDMTDVNEVWDAETPTTGGLRRLDNMELTNTTGNGKLIDARDELLDQKDLVDGVNRILGRLNELQDDVVSGRMAGAVTEEAARNLSTVERGSEFFLGKDGKISREKLVASIESNTMIGQLVVDYVKQTSGASVTEDEYQRLRMIIAGAANGSPAAMAVAMQTFRDGTVANIARDRDQLHIKYKLPATAYSMKDIENSQTDYRKMITSEGTPVMSIGGKADDKAWYEKATNSVTSFFSGEPKKENQFLKGAE